LVPVTSAIPFRPFYGQGMSLSPTGHRISPLLPTRMFEYNQILEELQDVFLNCHLRKILVFGEFTRKFCIIKQAFHSVVSVDIKQGKLSNARSCVGELSFNSHIPNMVDIQKFSTVLL
jgi:hypothetical protein